MTFYFRLLTFEMFRKEGAFHEEDGESRVIVMGLGYLKIRRLGQVARNKKSVFRKLKHAKKG